MSSTAPLFSPTVVYSPFTDKPDPLDETTFDKDEYDTRENEQIDFNPIESKASRLKRTTCLALLATASLVALLSLLQSHASGALAPFEAKILASVTSTAIDQCGVISTKARAHIEGLKEVSTGAIAATLDGTLISTSTQIPYPAHICLYAVVASNPEYPVREVAPDYWRDIGPDGIHWQITSDSAHIQLETPDIASLFPITYANYTDSPQYPHVYAQPVTIREAGVWTASAETALISWDWLRENQGVKDVYEYQNRPLQPTSFTVDAPAKMVEKPVCDATLGKTVDATGIWRINDTDPARPHMHDDFWHMSFQHSECQQPYYNPPAIRKCLANKKLHFYGDSNVRRATKMLQSEGTWCGMDKQYDSCQSEDYMEHAFPDGTVVGQVFSNACKNPPLSILDNTTIHFAFTGGLSIHPDCSTMAELAILAKRRLGLQQPPISPEEEQDVVYISSLSWELAFAPLDGYKGQLSELHQLLDQAYPSSKILLREATTVCCRGALKGSAGIKRTVLFNRLLQQEFADTNDRYHIVPVSALDGRRFSHEGKGMAVLYSNHLRSTEVSQEVQMIAHAICHS